jgi:hypothetical protein
MDDKQEYHLPISLEYFKEEGVIFITYLGVEVAYEIKDLLCRDKIENDFENFSEAVMEKCKVEIEQSLMIYN